MAERCSSIERVELLRSVDFFSEVPGRVLAAVAMLVDDVEVEQGGVLMERGEEGDAMYVVVTGRLAVHVGSARRIEFGPRSFVGELAALVPDRRTATVTALEPSTLIRLRGAVLQELLLDYPEIGLGVITALVARFRHQGAASYDDVMAASQ